MKRLFRLLLLALGMVWLGLVACSDPGGEGITALGTARFLMADDASPPADSRDWSDVALPDNWSSTRRNAQGIGWYRMSFDVKGPAPEGVAVLVNRLSMNGEFFVNGVRVLSGGKMVSPVTRNWNYPFFVDIPAPLLRQGANQLDVRVYAYRNSNGGLGTVRLGPSEPLRTQYQFLHALHVKGAIVSFAVALVAAFIGMVAWLRMSHDAVYGLFGLAMVAWVVRYTNYFVQDVPVDPTTFALVVNSAQGWFFVFFTPFLLRLTGLSWPRSEKALFAMNLVAMAIMFAAFQGWVPLWSVAAVWLLVWLPGSAALLLVSTRHAYRQRSVPASLAALVAWLYVPLTVRELLISTNLVAFDASYVAHYVGVPLVILIAWMLIDRVVSAARAASRAEIARARSALDERQRITQDMHDGLGLQLNAALGMVERGDLDRIVLSSALRACLDELRLIVDSSASDTGEFLPLLATLRFRMQSKLEAIGIATRWRMDPFPDTLALPPDMALQILRIVQEALNNAIKHADATVIEFEARTDLRPGVVTLSVRDNGCGFSNTAPADLFASPTTTGGTGLIGMRRRAANAGVHLDVRTSPEGTCVEIDIPNRPAPPPAFLAQEHAP